MLVVRSYGERYVRVGENGKLSVGFGSDCRALNISVVSEFNINWRFASSFI